MALASAPLRYPQSFLTPKALNLLVIHCPALSTSVMIGRPEAPARMVLGVSAKPVPQSGVRIGWCRRGRFVALGGAMLPGHPAGQPLADRPPAGVSGVCPFVIETDSDG